MNPLQGKPTAKEFIDKLETKEYGKLGPVLPPPNKECLVCLEQFKSDDKVLRLPCGHIFHVDCILPWLKVRNTCPACRKEFPVEQRPNNPP
mmetsp:Transcript_36517/g.26591  ORF Transcript_36517/g.26591 Transcript_36517/m.26591 type:complete len:91 (+) Transcript_36517:2068-2340(+)